MLLTPRTSRRCLRGMLPVALGLLLAVEPARAQEGVTRLTLEEAVGLATRANPTDRRGGVSLLEFLDAQRSYRETALAHLHALAGYLSAIYQLEADIGGSLGN